MGDDHDNWRRRLAGDWLPIDPNIPEPGCWRIRRGQEGWDAVQIWRTMDGSTGEIVPYASRAYVAIDGKVTRASYPWRHLWPKCAEHPVTKIAMDFFMTRGKWPDEIVVDDIPEGGNIAEAPEHEKYLAQVTALEVAAIAWFEQIGQNIKSQEEADKAANYKEQFLRWEQRSVAAGKKAKEPFKKEVERLNRAWSPVETKARDAKIVIADQWLKPYLLEQREKERLARLAAGTDPTLIVAHAKAGTGARASSARTKWKGKVNDYDAFLAWLLTLCPAHNYPHLRAALDMIANELVHARVKEIPGVEAIEEVSVI